MAEQNRVSDSAPPFLGGLVSWAMGDKNVSTTGQDASGNTVTGYGNDSVSSNADYQKKGGVT